MQEQKRCAVYVDGFNMYYGIMKFRPAWKWLNLRSYFEWMCESHTVAQIEYFTARIGAESQSEQNKSHRQAAYLSALKTLTGFKITFGLFQRKGAMCQKCFGEYDFPQEKKTDVNIAIAMVTDAMRGAYDSMVLVSGDSDLHPACYWIKKNRPDIKLCVYIPVLPEMQERRKADYLTLIGVPWSFLPAEQMAGHQFQETIDLGFKQIKRPPEWA